METKSTKQWVGHFTTISGHFFLPTTFSRRPWPWPLKSNNLQYNTLGHWFDGTNDSSTKRLMFQGLYFLKFIKKRNKLKQLFTILFLRNVDRLSDFCLILAVYASFAIKMSDSSQLIFWLILILMQFEANKYRVAFLQFFP